MPAVLQERVNVQEDSPRSPRQSSTTTPTKKLAVLAAANRLRAAQQHNGQTTAVHAGGTPTRNVSGVLGAAPLVVESQRYEEWMKIATDNVSSSERTTYCALTL